MRRCVPYFYVFFRMFIFSLFWHFWILTSTDFLAFLELFYWLFCFLMIYIVYIYLVLPYSLEVWNVSISVAYANWYNCFTLLIGGLKQNQLLLYIHLMLVLPYSLEVWNFITVFFRFFHCFFRFYLTHHRLFNVIKYTNKVVKISVPIDNWQHEKNCLLGSFLVIYRYLQKRWKNNRYQISSFVYNEKPVFELTF